MFKTKNKYYRFSIVLLTMLLIFSLFTPNIYAACNHDWSTASCTKIAYCRLCNETKGELSNHLYKKTANGDEKCIYCRIILDSGKEKFECKYCKIFYASQAEYDTHYKKMHPNTAKSEYKGSSSENLITYTDYNCRICSFQCSDSATNISHYLSVHSTSEVISETYETTSYIQTCHECSATFQRPEELTNHLYTIHDKVNTIYICTMCSQSFSDEASFDLHMETEERNLILKNELYKCSFCGINYETHQEYNACGTKHIEEIKANQRFHCNTCNTDFPSKEDLMNHMNSEIIKAEKEVAEYNAKVEEYNRNVMANAVRCSHCNGLFVNSAALTKHLNKVNTINNNNNNDSKMYDCPHCPLSFKERSNLSAHTKRVHAFETTKELQDQIAKSMFNCNPCNEKFKTFASVKNHNFLVHGEREDLEYRCEQHNKHYSAKENFVKHLASHTSTNPLYLCSIDICDFTAPSQKIINEHEKSNHKPSNKTVQETMNDLQGPHQDILNIKCTEHNLTFVDLQARARHMEAAHSTLFHCLECNFTTKEINERVKHENTPHTVICIKCNNSIIKEKITEHQNKEHAYECNECSFTISTNEKLIFHKKTQHPIFCSKCDYITTDNILLTAHNRSNHPVLPKCNICGFLFSDQELINEHMKNNHSYPIQNYCQKHDISFPSKELLNAHNLSHFSMQKYTCSFIQCSYYTYDKTQVRLHILSDHNTNLSCVKCDYSTKVKSELDIHEKSHEPKPVPEKKYECVRCSSFITKSEASEHNKTHAETCLFCDYKYPDNYSRDNHFDIHSAELIRNLLTKPI